MAGHQCPHCGAESTVARPYCLRCGHRTAGSEPPRQFGPLSARLLTASEPQPLLATASPGAVFGGSARRPVVEVVTEVPPAKDATPVRWKRRWFRRFALVASGLFLVMVAVLGFYAFRIHEVFDTVNSVTTPAAAISGAALGGPADLKIDTSPAKTALAGGTFPTETATPRPSITSTATSTSTATATATAKPSATSTSLPTPVPTRVPSLAMAPPPALPTLQPTATATATATPRAATAVESGPETVTEPAPTATRRANKAAARTVVVAPSAPATPTTTATTALTATAMPTATTAPPTATATATATATIEPSPTPSPEPTVVLSQIERVTNGNFEAGNDGWYVEQGARADPGDAHTGSSALAIGEAGGYADQQLFFVAGTTYHVTGYARLSRSSNTAGMVGIAFYDANGAQLPNTKPAPLAITASKWTPFAFDYTPPDGVAVVKIFFWKPASGAVLRVDDVSVRSIVPATALDTSQPIHDDSSITILLMGVDARPGEAIDIGVRPDSLMVLHLNPDTGSCRLLSIPRDTRTELPGYGLTKINHALAVGGIAYEQQVVEQFLKIKIDHYVLIDFNGFEDLVDAVGGITVDVPEAFTSDEGITFNPGEQTMNGQQALAYARWRGGSDGDFGRQQRQQLILRALLRKGYGLNIVRSINELLPAVADNLRTDLSPSAMAGIASDYRSRCTESSLTLLGLDGSAATFQDPLLQMPLYYIVVDEAEVASKVAALMEP